MPDAAVVYTPGFNSGVPTDPLQLKGRKLRLGASSFSTPPTIAEINASSDWWQVWALYNRRASQIYASPTYLSITTGGLGNWPTAASINVLRAAINTMRTDVGLSAYSFGSDVVTGHSIRAQDLTDLRASLHPAFFQTNFMRIAPSNAYQSTRVDNPFGTQMSASSTAVSGTTLTGTAYSGSTATRKRLGISYLVPANFNSAVVITISTSGTAFERASVYGSNTDDHAGGGSWWTHLDNAFVTNQATFNLNSFAIPTSFILGKAGQYISFVLGNYDEMRDNPTAHNMNMSAGASLNLNVGL